MANSFEVDTKIEEQDQKIDSGVRNSLSRLLADKEFAVQVANLMKSPDKKMSMDNWEKVAMSLPRLYAVIEAGELAVKLGLSQNLVEAFNSIANGSGRVFDIACVCARLAWQAQQPLIGSDRLGRPVMQMTSGNLPPEEFSKDNVRVRETAKLLISNL